jgi:acetyltransferase-like isoleucine patch superfamily enzyme
MSNQDNICEGVERRLKRCGVGIHIYPLTRIIAPEMVEVDDYAKIDDFVFINGGNGVKIGRYVHIAAFTSIFGGGKCILEDYAGISEGVRIITGTETYKEGKRMSAALPLEQRNPVIGVVHIGKDAFVGANSVVHPNVRIGKGAIVGSNSLVLNDVEPWSINVGSPCKKIGERQKVTVPDI